MGGRGNKSVQSDSIHFLILLTRTPPPSPSRLHAIRDQRSFFENEPLSRVHRFCLHTVLHVACTGQMHPNETAQQQFRDTSLKFRFSPTIETLPIYFFKVPINNKTKQSNNHFFKISCYSVLFLTEWDVSLHAERFVVIHWSLYFLCRLLNLYFYLLILFLISFYF